MHLFGPDASKRTNPLVYLFTDCQASGWREVKNQGLEGLIPDKTPFVVVNVGAADDLANRAVIGDAPRRGRAVAGLPYLLQPRVVNTSKKESAEVTLTVFIEDKEVSRATLTLKPGETAVRRIPYTPREAGLLRGRFEVGRRHGRPLPRRRPLPVHAQRVAAHQGRDRGRPGPRPAGRGRRRGAFPGNRADGRRPRPAGGRQTAVGRRRRLPAAVRGEGDPRGRPDGGRAEGRPRGGPGQLRRPHAAAVRDRCAPTSPAAAAC